MTTHKHVPSTTIYMEPKKVTVTSIDEHGIKTVKNSNIETIQQIFTREQSMETPLLPSQWGVVKYYRKNQYEGYVLTTPPTERDVTFDTSVKGVPKKATVPVPPLLWVFEVMTDGNGKKTLTHSILYALKHELLSLNDKAYHAPYPNIGVPHGICWGYSNTPDVPTAKSLQNIPARFFSQAFNNDLSAKRVNSFEWEYKGEEVNTTSALYHMVEMANRLKEAKRTRTDFTYPFEMLKTSNTLKVQDVIQMFLPGILN